ncbi:amino acid ABC transporter ATP-binding protein [Lactococcus termiticola]|uniref:Amino acid ABC transporter ATP-binding protein n=1 Tax=Lactococcus termiticola TaxID=2169526 RepID=A0A2R5HJ12_9LACT|nr:ATP-binding cassette domain-containing protein [Lactococcus termiticola]GBG96121.1 amino acid ABC transporter ATP-binding protein [Lactococcus termiticola]
MLKIEKLNKKFQEKVLFEDFSLELKEQEILAIVGPSGGGKTTLLRMLAGLESIDWAEISLKGEVYKIKNQSFSQASLGFVFQDFQLFPHLTVMENLILSPVKTQKLPRKEAVAKAGATLASLELSGLAELYPYALSGGQKQRVALARAMMIDPEIICYDEPTSALDPELRDQVAEMILANKAGGATQIVVSHDMDFAEKVADRILQVNPRN